MIAYRSYLVKENFGSSLSKNDQRRRWGAALEFAMRYVLMQACCVPQRDAIASADNRRNERSAT